MRMARSTGIASGLLVMVLGIWGALIPFVGPYFNYSFGINTTWHYTTDRLWLNILPGALAVIAGLLLLRAATRAAGILAGWLGVIAGAWFVVGPAVSMTWESGTGPIGRPLFGSTRQMLELVGYFYGLGALIVALAAFSIGRFASRPRLAERDAIARSTGRGTLTQAPPPPPSATAPAPSERATRRRFPFPRRGRAVEPSRPGGRIGGH
jgi:peptidoglycan/LPS O-acetylase OafA/YrhL